MTNRQGTRTAWAVALALTLASSPGAPEPRVRPPALAGQWYPDGRIRLLSSAHYLMRTVSGAPRLGGPPLALVVPPAGWAFSGLAAATAYRQLRPGDFDRVVVVGPSHHAAFDGYALDDSAAYRTPLGEVPLCEGVSKILTSDAARVREGVTGPEHAVEVGLPFLQVALGSFCLVPVLTGDTDPAAQSDFAERLSRLDDGRTLFVFSSDFTHYGPRYDFEPFGPLSPATRERIRELDDRAAALLERKEADAFRAYLDETGSTICGRHGLATLLELLPRIAPGAEATLLAHYASADLAGSEDGSSVTYVALAYTRPGAGMENGSTPQPGSALVDLPQVELVSPDSPKVSEETGRRLVRLARSTLEAELEGKEGLGRTLADWPDGAERERRQGVFVSLYRTDPLEIQTRGLLRACRGQALPLFPLYFGTVQATLDAARDERFPAVAASELDRLQVEVTVLSPVQAVPSPAEIHLGTHGIVVEKDGRVALFLPQVPGQNRWSLEQTLGALAEKAGLSPDAWKEDARLYVFTAQVFAEER
jgi:AmmeMemoRadiSam system protein B/AmmeMemoRadiSam system protein A